jgi:hypothetical protein
MKSPMVLNCVFIDNKERYSDLQIMRSGAGWYIGTAYSNPLGFDEPGTRDSGYFAKREEAEKYLAEVIKLGPELASVMLRDMP